MDHVKDKIALTKDEGWEFKEWAQLKIYENHKRMEHIGKVEGG